jgi:hypothetical protein
MAAGGARVDSKIEIARLVSGLRGLLRGEIERCEQAIAGGDLDGARKEIADVHDRVSYTWDTIGNLLARDDAYNTGKIR